MAVEKKTRGLGRGLSALMSDIGTDVQPESASRKSDMSVPIERVKPNPDQPRRRFDEDLLDDLAASVREKGIIQPLIVRPLKDDAGSYEIIAGERRWRAAQRAQLHEVPVIIREYSDTEVLEIAIIENIQRADLNPVEEAAGYHQLMTKFGHTQEKLAAALGKSRSHIANSMRLLQLPDPVQTMLESGQLTAGHARALITSEDPLKIARDVIRRSLSVRDTEKLVKKLGSPTSETPKRSRAAAEKDADTQALENDLAAQLRMKVTIDHKPGQEGGSVTIRYATLDQLDKLCSLLSGEASDG